MIKIKSSNVDLVFDHHVNIVVGDKGLGLNSGENKSYLFSVLEECKNNELLETNVNLILLSSTESVRDIKITSTSCILIDEANFAPKQLEWLFNEVKKFNVYLIVLGRLNVKSLEYSVDAVYKLKLNEGRFTLRQFFKNDCIKKNIDGYYTEDSTSVAAIYTDILEQEVQPVSGKNRFFEFIKNDREVLIIADKPKFGSALITLLYKCLSSNSEVEIIHAFFIESFEQIVSSIVFENYDEILNEARESFDSETFFETYLAENLQIWNKKKLIVCIKEISKRYDFASSSVLNDLKQFCENNNFCTENTYEFDLSSYEFKSSILERLRVELEKNNQCKSLNLF